MPPRRTAKPATEPKPKEIEPLVVHAIEVDLKRKREPLPLPPLPSGFDPSKITKNPNIDFRQIKVKPERKAPAPREGENQTATSIETAVQGILSDLGFSETLKGFSGLTPQEKELKYFEALAALRPGQYDRAFNRAKDLVGHSHSRLDALLDEYKRRVHELLNPEVSSLPALPRAIPPPQIETPEPGMIEDDRVITKHGSRYLPVSLAAQQANVARTTLVDWIKAKAKFQGRALQTYHSPTMRKLYLSEESVQRVANRFVKWPSNEPAGPVALGETRDKSGYIGIAKAARSIGVDHHTMWLWTAHGTAPTDKSLDVIKCSASDQFYIREKDISQLKKLVPPSGLRRGPRTHQATPN
jgi:hypothetical protein